MSAVIFAQRRRRETRGGRPPETETFPNFGRRPRELISTALLGLLHLLAQRALERVDVALKRLPGDWDYVRHGFGYVDVYEPSRLA